MTTSILLKRLKLLIFTNSVFTDIQEDDSLGERTAIEVLVELPEEKDDDIISGNAALNNQVSKIVVLLVKGRVPKKIPHTGDTESLDRCRS